MPQLDPNANLSTQQRHLIVAEVIKLVCTCNEPMFHAMRPKTPQHLGSAKTEAQMRPARVQRVDSVCFSWALCKDVIVLILGSFGKETYQTRKGIGVIRKTASSLWVAGVTSIKTSKNKWQGLSRFGAIQWELVPVGPHRHHVHGNHAAKSSGSANDKASPQTFSFHFKPTSDWEELTKQKSSALL